MRITEKLKAANGDYFWAPSDIEIVDREDIKYSYADREAGVFNRVTQANLASGQISDAIRDVKENHDGSLSYWQLAAPSRDQKLVSKLLNAGYREECSCYTMAVDAASYSRKLSDDVEVSRVGSLEEIRHFYDVQLEVFGGQQEPSQERLKRELQDCTGPDCPVVRFIAYHRGELAGVGAISLFEGCDCGMLWGGSVLESHQGRGCYTGLLQARADICVARDISTMGLHAKADTSAPIVAAHGFERFGKRVDYSLDMRG